MFRDIVCYVQIINLNDDLLKYLFCLNVFDNNRKFDNVTNKIKATKIQSTHK